MTRILVRRTGALGDVLCATPVLRYLRDWYGRDAQIVVETGCPEALLGNPHVSTVLLPGRATGGFHRVIDLDLVYESKPTAHIVDAYFDHAGIPRDYKHKRVIFGIEPPPPPELIREDRLVTIHAAKSWPSRSLPSDFWVEAAFLLAAREYRVLFIGAGSDFKADGVTSPFIGSAVGQTSLRETANLIASSMCLLCSDSSLLHLAGATDTPIVGLFTSVRAKYRVPYRHGERGWRVKALEADVPCQGCLETLPAPATSLSCRYGTDACIYTFRPDIVVEAIEEMVNDRV
jgi:ADP-heptose:LPS heptosyltransferase